jgi:AAA+ superfamily predicted ATPase
MIHPRFLLKIALLIILYFNKSCLAMQAETKVHQQETKERANQLNNRLCYAKEVAEIVNLLKKNRSDLEDVHKKYLLIGHADIDKTDIAKAMALEAGIVYHLYSGPDLVINYQLSSKKNLDEIFKRTAAVEGRCLIIIENIEALAAHAEAYARFQALLKAYAKSSVFCIGITNNATQDLQRDFEGCAIKISLPNQSQRADIVACLMRAKTNTVFVATAEEIAQRTEGLSADDLRVLIELSIQIASIKNSSGNTISIENSLQAIIIMKKYKEEINKDKNFREKFARKTRRHTAQASNSRRYRAAGIGLTVTALLLYATRRRWVPLARAAIPAAKNCLWSLFCTCLQSRAEREFQRRAQETDSDSDSDEKSS